MTLQKGSCYNGGMPFDVAGETQGASRYDNSFYQHKSTVRLTAIKGVVSLIASEEHLSLDQWNNRTGQHYFCRHCEIARIADRAAKTNIAIIQAALTGLIQDSWTMYKLLSVTKSL